MRKPRKLEFLWFLSFHPEGMTVDEIVGDIWPRSTVFRLLKQLLAERKVLKERDSKRDGCRGRPTVRYKVNPKLIFFQKWPVKRIGRMWVPATIHRRAYSGTEFPVVKGKWKTEYEEHRAWLKEHEPKEYEKFLKLERQRKHLNRRSTARTKL